VTLIESIDQDIKTAMKAKEAEKVTTLRMVKAAMTNALIEMKKNELTDEDATSIIQKQVKQRRESHEAYEKAGRQDLADKEKSEIGILEKYLPKQLSEDEISSLAKAAIEACGAKSKAEIGMVMKELMPKVKGKADGKTVNKVVAALLQ